MENTLIEILLVEDNPDDAGLTIRALKKINLANNLLHLQDGEEALKYLFSKDTLTFPKLILLDLKMPKVDGLEVLKKIKMDETLKVIPVVMLTSSKEEQDIFKSYELGVNSFVVKPVDFNNFSKAVADLGLYWMLINQPSLHSEN